MFIVLVLAFGVITPTCFALNPEILDNIIEQIPGNHCVIPNNILDEYCDREIENGRVESNTKCIGYDHLGQEIQILCVNGFWVPGKYTDTNALDYHRNKRFWEILVPIFVVVAQTIICIILCGIGENENENRIDNPPVVQNCPDNINKNADNGKTTSNVRWNIPTCTDDKGTCRLEGPIGKGPGSTFEGRNVIVYTGMDKAGQTDTCRFKVNINVRTCGSLRSPTYSTRNCRPPNFMYMGEIISGTVCRFSCQTGYELVGESVITCKESGQYNSSIPKCEAITCPSPVQVTHGSISCSEPNYVYNSVCYLQCKDGYKSQSTSSIQCKVDKTWTTKFDDCIDAEPPEIQCSRNLIFYAERSESYANVVWEEPKVTDNSGGLITLKYNAEITNNSNAEAGLYEVKYIAEDESGNFSPCSFIVRVEVISCPPPRLVDKNILYECPNDYGYGWNCSLSCLYRYPLEGSPIITCEKDETTSTPTGRWYWNSTKEPSCIENLCSPLDPPQNGALSCSSVGPNKFCTMACNDKFDIPKTLTSTQLIVCDNEGKWSPIKEVPDCTEKRNPQSMNLPGEMYYYTGDCNNMTVQNEIKNNFVTFANEKNNQGWGNFCPESPCTVKDVEVSCGPSSVRRKRSSEPRNKRSAFEILLSYTINMPWVDSDIDGLNYNSKLIEKLGEVITNASKTGELDVEDLAPSGVSYSSSSIDCPKGQTPRYSTSSCAGCPSGTFYDELSDDCQQCPLGSYQDNAFQLSCKTCLDGTLTERKGARNGTSCKEVCPSGHYSTFGVIPCSPCSIGFYQPSSGSVGCIPCPSETTTELVGSTEITQCKGFDIQFETDDIINSVSIPSNLSMVVSVFWLKVLPNEYNNELFNYHDGIVSIHLRRTVHFEVNRKMMDTAVAVRTSSWIKFVLKTDLNSRSVQLFVDGKEIAKENITYVAAELVAFKVSKGIKLSSFVMTNATVQPGNIIDNKTTCKSHVQSKILGMDIFKSLNSTSFTFQIPSQCDHFETTPTKNLAIDDCLTNPCGNRTCTDYVGGYTCQCNGGYTGKNCEIPPDHCKTNNCSNGSVCLNNKNNYTCTCADGYRGPLCDIAIVNGKWGSWARWMDCTQSCEGGTRYRQRYCDNPPPDPDGKYCADESNQTEVCNQQECPTCPSARTLQQYGNILNCSETKDQISCLVTCRSGLVFARGHRPLDRYECGASTGFQWNALPPSCSKATSPKKVDVRIGGGYRHFPCNTIQNAKSQLLENVKDIQCIKNGTCQSSISITGCSSTQRKKRESSDVHASISLTTRLTGGDNLKLQDFFESNIVTPELMAYIQVYTELESSAQQINQSKPFQITNEGYEYDVDSIGYDVKMTCEPGSIQSDGLCVDCPIGTSQIGESCVMCEVGTYQDGNGGIVCKQCPDGYTTEFIGSRNITDCKAIETSETDLKNRINDIEGDKRTLTIVLCVAGGIIAVIFTFLISYKFRNYLRRRERFQQKSSSHVSLDMVRPTTTTK